MLGGDVALGAANAVQGQTFMTVAGQGTALAGVIIFKNGDEILKIVDKLGNVFIPVSQNVDDAGRFAARGVDNVVVHFSNGRKVATNRLQDLTPDQLSYQRLLDGVDELDVTTGRSQSVFYSGRGAREAAENHATSNGLTTLEQTAGGRHLDDLRLFDGTVADVGGDQAANVWGRVSSNYAPQASGDVTAIVNNPRPTSIFLTQELPTLLQNPNVTQVTVRSTSGAQVSIPRGTAIDDALRMLEGF